MLVFPKALSSDLWLLPLLTNEAALGDLIHSQLLTPMTQSRPPQIPVPTTNRTSPLEYPKGSQCLWLPHRNSLFPKASKNGSLSSLPPPHFHLFQVSNCGKTNSAPKLSDLKQQWFIISHDTLVWLSILLLLFLGLLTCLRTVRELPGWEVPDGLTPKSGHWCWMLGVG